MTRTAAARIHEYGGPEVLRFETVALPEPGEGEATVRHTVIGLNYIDTYHRTGLYPLDGLPATLGVEGVGVVEAVGPRVEDVAIGDRVASTGSIGSYAERRVVKADRLVRIPPGLDDEIVAAGWLKGLTAQMLLRRVAPVGRGDSVLIHAAAGGVGLLLCQWAAALGARVIGTVGSEAKAELAAGHGCSDTILYAKDDFAERVADLVPGGVAVVFDGVGAATFDASLRCLAPFGTLVSFGNASGAVPPVRLLDLTPRNLYVTRPSVTVYTRQRAVLVAAAAELFDALADGTVQPLVGQRFPLAEVTDAHRALEARSTRGSTLLIP